MELLYLQYNTTQHNTAQHNTAQHSTAQHSTADRAQQSTAEHSTAQHTEHSTAQHNTIQFLTLPRGFFFGVNYRLHYKKWKKDKRSKISHAFECKCIIIIIIIIIIINHPSERGHDNNYNVGMLWFNFILDSNFIFLCFKLIIIYYHTQKQRKIKFEPSIKLNHKIVLYYFVTLFSPICVFSTGNSKSRKVS